MLAGGAAERTRKGKGLVSGQTGDRGTFKLSSQVSKILSMRERNKKAEFEPTMAFHGAALFGLLGGGNKISQGMSPLKQCLMLQE